MIHIILHFILCVGASALLGFAALSGKCQTSQAAAIAAGLAITAAGIMRLGRQRQASAPEIYGHLCVLALTVFFSLAIHDILAAILAFAILLGFAGRAAEGATDRRSHDSSLVIIGLGITVSALAGTMLPATAATLAMTASLAMAFIVQTADKKTYKTSK